VDIIIRPQIYARYRRLLHTSHLLIIEGMVQRESGVVNVLALRLATFSGHHPSSRRI
jgi:hypothetical protein